MKIIISPAKKMNIDDDIFEYRSKPVFFEQAEEIMNYMTIIIIIIFNIQIIAIFIRSVKRECISISQSIMHQTDNIEYFISWKIKI